MLPNLLSSAGYLLVTFLNAWALGGTDSRFRHPVVGNVSAQGTPLLHRQHLGAFSAPGSGKAQALRASWELSRMSRMRRISRMKTNRAWETRRIAMGVTCS